MIEPYWCKCNHSRGYHNNYDAASLLSKRRTGSCTYNNCDCIKYKPIPENRPSFWKKSFDEWLLLIPLLILNNLILFYLVVPGFGMHTESTSLLELFGLVLLYKAIQICIIIIHLELTRNMFGQRERREMKGVRNE